MGLLTKISKTRADYQQWLAAELTNGDIIDLVASLGHPAHSVIIESPGGDTTVRFNVVEPVYNQPASWVGGGQGTLRQSGPLKLGENERPGPDLVITSGTSQTWTQKDLSIRDIKIVTKSTGLKITVC